MIQGCTASATAEKSWQTFDRRCIKDLYEKQVFFFLVNSLVWGGILFWKVQFLNLQIVLHRSKMNNKTCWRILFVLQSKVTVAAVKYKTWDGFRPTPVPPCNVCEPLITVECRVYVLWWWSNSSLHVKYYRVAFCCKYVNRSGCAWLRGKGTQLSYEATRLEHLQS